MNRPFPSINLDFGQLAYPQHSPEIENPVYKTEMSWAAVTSVYPEAGVMWDKMWEATSAHGDKIPPATIHLVALDWGKYANGKVFTDSRYPYNLFAFSEDRVNEYLNPIVFNRGLHSYPASQVLVNPPDPFGKAYWIHPGWFYVADLATWTAFPSPAIIGSHYGY